jgi:hypothetical protein
MLVVLAFACSQTPRMSEENETDYIRMLREEFFKTHPEGKFNEYISRGEVVRGMDFLEVLASWGNPNKREKPTESVEFWTYLDEDEDSQDWVQYKFVFRKNVLDDWEVARHVAGAGHLDTTGDSGNVLTKGESPSSSGLGAKKKK